MDWKTGGRGLRCDQALRRCSFLSYFHSHMCIHALCYEYRKKRIKNLETGKFEIPILHLLWISLCPIKKDVKVLTPRTSEYGFIQKLVSLWRWMPN